MNPPIIDILRQQRNDAMDQLANVLAENHQLRQQLAEATRRLKEVEEKK